MPSYTLIHQHEYGASLYRIETDFNLFETIQDYDDWATRIARCLDLDYDPQQGDSFQVLDPTAFEEASFTREEFEKAGQPAESPAPDTDKD